ncbi:MAG: undecaprenyl-phosphate galactose phosphotransferase WbaP [bacterium]|nr:undecaprenyl-phosphate galactose phosphotransferase WbaP [bacterium]
MFRAPCFPSRRTILVMTDIVFLLLTYVLVVLLYDIFNADLLMRRYWQLTPYLLICPALNFFTNLYSPAAISPHSELSTLGKNVTVTYMGIALSLYFTQRGILISRGVILTAWLLSIWTVPLGRYLARRLFRSRPWWGPSALLFGPPSGVEHLLKHIRQQFDPAIHPVGYAGRETIAGLVSYPDEDAISVFLRDNPVSCAVVIVDNKLDQMSFSHIIRSFRYVILMPLETLAGTTPVLGNPISFGTALGFMPSQNLLDHKRALLKRLCDIVCSLIGLVVLSPVFVLIALFIVLESPGNPFFRHRRIGVRGRSFSCYKFRSMRRDAQATLDKLLESNADLAMEWEQSQKLKNDPRITRIGLFLRRSSLDELPQLFNVLRGDMSLVGPRPIVRDEIPRYGDTFALYTRVRPGITGLWQVSGRSDTSYSYRVSLDRYYIYNWSLMLDILILLKTIPVVLGKRGAY